jgi:hypothetical protein
MWSVIPALAIVLAQAAQSGANPGSVQWCFDRDQGAQLCEQTEAACNELRDINSEIARSQCRPVYRPTIGLVPTEPPAPPNPARQTPTQR